MDDYESLSHSKWECKYHVVFIPKCRRKTLYLELRRHPGDRVYGEKKRNFVGQHFWVRGYFVSTVGWDTSTSRNRKRRTNVWSR
jgi:putative transposase